MRCLFFKRIDKRISIFLQRISPTFSRLALFIVFFWFGALKVVAISPANPLIESLLEKTFSFISFENFVIFLGVYEMFIGIIFLIPRLERVAVIFLIPHMITTSLPLFFLPAVTWQGFLMPTLEGQYVIKNLVIVALAFVMGSRLVCFTRTNDIIS